jgi:hypothetical protein
VAAARVLIGSAHRRRQRSRPSALLAFFASLPSRTRSYPPPKCGLIASDGCRKIGQSSSSWRVVARLRVATTFSPAANSLWA